MSTDNAQIDYARFPNAWKKGQSGNPTGLRKDGKPRLPQRKRIDIKALAREHCPDAIRVLSNIMRSSKHPGSTRVAAASTLLDRGYGKPLQTIDITAILGAFDLTRLSDEQLATWEELVHEASGPSVDKSGLPALIEGELRAAILDADPDDAMSSQLTVVSGVDADQEASNTNGLGTAGLDLGDKKIDPNMDEG